MALRHDFPFLSVCFLSIFVAIASLGVAATPNPSTDTRSSTAASNDSSSVNRTTTEAESTTAKPDNVTEANADAASTTKIAGDNTATGHTGTTEQTVPDSSAGGLPVTATCVPTISDPGKSNQTGSCQCPGDSLLPLAVVLSFIGGALVVGIPLLLQKLHRQRKWCFAEKEEPVKDKWHNASLKITDKVIRMHTLKRLNEVDILAKRSSDNHEYEISTKMTEQTAPEASSGVLDNDPVKAKTEKIEELEKSDIFALSGETICSEGQQGPGDNAAVSEEEIDIVEMDVDDVAVAETGDLTQSCQHLKPMDSNCVHRANGFSGMSDLEIFEYQRESTLSEVSMDNCFVFENENFRTSRQSKNMKVNM